MQFDRHLDWQTWMRDFAVAATAILISQLIHYAVYAVVGRLRKGRMAFAAQAIIRFTSRPARLFLALIALSAAMPSLNATGTSLTHAIEIGYILAVAWTAIGFIEIVNALVTHHLPEDKLDDVQARRTHTQVHLLRQIVIGVILFSALAAVLMTFPPIRTLGAGLFASAGLAGLAIGMAARPTLGNLIAGIQIALTEPIRIDDAVVVEGEFGRIAEVHTTYVVVRLWDLRNMVVPLTYFIEKPFQNWTRNTSDLIGAVKLHTDYRVSFAKLRDEYQRILESSPLWDGKTAVVQVTDTTERTVEVRFLMSAANPTATFDLRCHAREKLIEYLQAHHPEGLPRVWNNVRLE